MNLGEPLVKQRSWWRLFLEGRFDSFLDFLFVSLRFFAMVLIKILIPVIFLHSPRKPNKEELLCETEIWNMGFLVTTLIFVVIGIIASLCTRICCNRGPSANLFHLTLVITATVCCWMMWAIVYLAQMKPLIVPILSEGE
ncbi:hypothetical protein GQ457_11G012690 [Hibiscus cannabinus]